MIESNVDDALAELGRVPENLSAIVSHTLGDTALTLPNVDEMLAGLGGGLAPALGGRGAGFATTLSDSHPTSTPVAAVVARAPLDDRSWAESPAPLDPSLTPAPTPAPAAPQLTAAERRRAEFAAAMLDSAAPPPPDAADAGIDDAQASDLSQAFEGDTDLSEPPPRGPSGAPPAERRLEGEATAQAIVAAFDDPDFDAELSRRRTAQDDAGITFDSSPAAALELPPPAALELGARLRRGSRRPELDRLLDQPLDALDFERSEPAPIPASGAVKSSDAPAAAPPEDANDDFEILVDDEILEIDEGDLVDEDSSS